MTPTDRAAAEAYAESCDNESGGFLTHQLEAIRRMAFLAGLAHARKEQEQLVEAMTTLLSEMRGTLVAHEYVIRSDHGNTNFECLQLRLRTADEALAHYRGASAKEGEKCEPVISEREGKLVEALEAIDRMCPSMGWEMLDTARSALAAYAKEGE